MTDATLKNLAALSRSLNEASDLLSKQIVQVEAALNELNLGVSAWVVISKTEEDVATKKEDGPMFVDHVLEAGYGKHKGKWGLLFLDSRPDFDNYDVTFLRDSPREHRIAAVEKLPELLKALEAEAAKVTEQATKKAGEMKQFAAALNKIAR
jgi:hypothetical protein